MMKHQAMIQWLDPFSEPLIHIVGSVRGKESALRLAKNWVENHPQRGSLVNAEVKYLGRSPL